ncbi:MAG: hypothetical protein F6K31_21240 [Symploca sp. SIO2G7]|nr:hypothetical protein [Symploca sp. SIO2G7]
MKPESTVSYVSNGAKISNPRILNTLGKQVNVLLPMQAYYYCYDVLITQLSYEVRCGMLIKTVNGLELGGIATHPKNQGLVSVKENTRFVVKFQFKTQLNPGAYFLNAGVVARGSNGESYLDRLIDAYLFKIMPYKNQLSTGYVNFSAQKEDSRDMHLLSGLTYLK